MTMGGEKEGHILHVREGQFRGKKDILKKRGGRFRRELMSQKKEGDHARSVGKESNQKKKSFLMKGAHG